MPGCRTSGDDRRFKRGTLIQTDIKKTETLLHIKIVTLNHIVYSVIIPEIFDYLSLLKRCEVLTECAQQPPETCDVDEIVIQG